VINQYLNNEHHLTANCNKHELPASKIMSQYSFIISKKHKSIRILHIPASLDFDHEDNPHDGSWGQCQLVHHFIESSVADEVFPFLFQLKKTKVRYVVMKFEAWYSGVDQVMPDQIPICRLYFCTLLIQL
jgi:hypothetical protein